MFPKQHAALLRASQLFRFTCEVSQSIGKISQSLARLWRFRVKVVSRAKRGTSTYQALRAEILPRFARQDTSLARKRQRLANKKISAARHPNHMRSSTPEFRILMVDDMTRYQTLYEMAITDALPARVSFATDGEEALAKLENSLYDLLILDLNMPKLGGEETLKKIRRDPSFDGMPVIILTGDSDLKTQGRLLDLGADDFVEKGAPPEIFVARLKAQMRHKLALNRLTQMAVDMDIFAAGVLHDIRNLETTILAISEIAQRYIATDPTAHREEMLGDLVSLEDKADKLGRYASEIINMVRETRQALNPKPQDLIPLIEWAVRMAQPPRPTLAAKKAPNANLTYEIQGVLKPVIADKHFLQLALLNIIQNSVKYARPDVAPHIVVSQVISPRAENRVPGLGTKTIVTRIRDNGLGIKQEELRRVFEPFVRGMASGKHDKGFGLGLSLVAKVIKTMEGRVWAELPQDERGPGSIICIELPVAPK
jgi:signal transduction histidine kinase